MQPNSLVGLLGLALIVALAATAFKDGSNVANILSAGSNGFANIVRASTLQPSA